MDPVTCIFCTPGPDDIILDNEYAYARYDTYPVSPRHLLIIPKRHISSIFHATEEEITALWELVREAKGFLDRNYSPDGYNIWINDDVSRSVVFIYIIITISRKQLKIKWLEAGIGNG